MPDLFLLMPLICLQETDPGESNLRENGHHAGPHVLNRRR